MAFTMSYSIDPPEAPKPKAAAPKTVKAKPSRVRKVNSPLAQAQALFEPAPARPAVIHTEADSQTDPETTA
jgi:hypothetical protein